MGKYSEAVCPCRKSRAEEHVSKKLSAFDLEWLESGQEEEEEPVENDELEVLHG